MKSLPVNQMSDVTSETEQVEHELARLADQRIGQDASTIISEVVKQSDVDRLMTGATLVNAFNFAIQQQAKRGEWTSQDYRAFCVALAAMDQIK